MSTYKDPTSTLELAIKSVVQQTITDWELLIVFEPDDTIPDFLKHNKDERIQILHGSEKLGRSNAYNWAINEAKGTFIARMDSDDFAKETRFEKQLSFMIENPDIDLLGTACEMVDSNGVYKGRRIFPSSHEDCIKRCMFSTPLLHPTFFWRRERIRAVEYYADKYSIACDDLDFILRILKIGGKIANLSEPLLIYRIPFRYMRDKSNWQYNFTTRLEHTALCVRYPKLLIGLFAFGVLSVLPKSIINLITSNSFLSGLFRGITK